MTAPAYRVLSYLFVFRSVLRTSVASPGTFALMDLGGRTVLLTGATGGSTATKAADAIASGQTDKR